jgi:hypothetical protein
MSHFAEARFVYEPPPPVTTPDGLEWSVTSPPRVREAVLAEAREPRHACRLFGPPPVWSGYRRSANEPVGKNSRGTGMALVCGPLGKHYMTTMVYVHPETVERPRAAKSGHGRIER